ncbi:DnaJ C-terminal domain-containing protein [Synechococcus sp. M16CYN]|uniref:DnaJ C-terminal domain-containing protein n=1 Tax=Synechococcus sp. M16CYN TaxID=3103139 RepID=UPI003243599C
MAGSGYKDYFQVLGVDRSVDSEGVKRAFRKLARQYHPDVNPGNQAAEERFKEISEAYEVLSDSDKRRRYEQFGQYWNQVGGTGGRAPGVDVDFGRYGNFDDFINDLLGRFGGSGGTPGFQGGGFPGVGFPRGGQAARSPANLDAEASVRITFTEAYRGGERTLSVNNERVQVRIPAGVRDGSRLRLRGKGNLQPGTGRRGDLYLSLTIKPHAIWRFDGDQLCANLPVSFDELALGGVVTVMTLDGEVQVSIPARTPPGRSLRLKNKGWPLKNGRGDLLLTLSLDMPKSWNAKEQQLLEQLRLQRSTNPRHDWLRSATL